MRQRLCRCCRGWHDTDQPWPHNCYSHFGERGPRSDLPTPMFIVDSMESLQHPVNGQYYDSKSEFRRITKASGGEEIGTEKQADRRWNDSVTRDEVGQAIQMVNQGYRPSLQTENQTLD